MDPPVNLQNPIDLDWFNYFDNIDQDDQHLFRDGMLEHRFVLSEKLLVQNISPLKQDQNLISECGLQDFDPLKDLTFWDCLVDDLPFFSNNDDSSEYHSLAYKYGSSFGAVTSNHSGFQDFIRIEEDLGLWDCWDNDFPLLSCIDSTSECLGEVECTSGAATADQGGRKKVAKRSRPLEFEEIEKHFEMPIVMAAKELGIGLTALKKRCRELNIKRWPHRKLKSLQSVIQNVKELGLEGEIRALEEHKKMMEKLPEMKLTERTKKLRQACFKANYKKRRLNSTHYSFRLQFP